jgi:cell division protein FtsB
MQRTQRNRLLLSTLLVVAVLLGIFLLFGENGLMHVRRLKSQQESLAQKVQNLQAENEMLRRQIDKLATGGEATEKAIRDQLGYVKSDETIIVFNPSTATQSGYQ